MADHQHGSIDVRDHEKTFNGFIRFVTWAAIIVLLILIFMALVNA